MDLSRYQLQQLNQLKKDIDRELASRRNDDARKARRELREVAEKYGFDLNDLVSGAATRSDSGGRRGASGSVRFRHPSDPSRTWTGRGRKPTWIKEWEAAGRSLEKLRLA